MPVVYCCNRECVNAAKMVCSRCNSEFYCSKPCQIRAFSEHRFNCFELPSLRVVDETNSSFQRLSMQEDVSSQVGGLHKQILSPTASGIENTLKEANVFAPIVDAPKLSLKTTMNSQISISPAEPNAVVDSPKKSKPAAPVEAEKPKAASKPQEVPKSNASTISTNRPIRMNQFTPTQAIKPKEDRRIVYEDLKVKSLPKAFKAVFLDGNIEEKIFSICTLEDHNFLNQIANKIAAHIETCDQKPHAPKRNEIVLAKFEDVFYRGVCKEKLKEGYSISYIDYGNSAVVKEEDIRPLNEKLMFDIVVHSCFIENFPDDIDEHAANILQGDGVPLYNVQMVKDSYIAKIEGL